MEKNNDKKFDKNSKTVETSPIEKILDENNLENIILYNESGEPLAFEQIALIPLDNGKEEDDLYAILRPAENFGEMTTDDVWAFLLDIENDNILPVQDKEIIDRVFDAYNKLAGYDED